MLAAFEKNKFIYEKHYKSSYSIHHQLLKAHSTNDYFAWSLEKLQWSQSIISN